MHTVYLLWNVNYLIMIPILQEKGDVRISYEHTLNEFNELYQNAYACMRARLLFTFDNKDT